MKKVNLIDFLILNVNFLLIGPIFVLFCPFSNTIDQKMVDFDNFSVLLNQFCNEDKSLDHKFGSKF